MTRIPTQSEVWENRALRQAVKTYLSATALAKVERERCDAIQRRVLAAEPYYYTTDRGIADPRAGKRLTDPKDTWLMDEGDARDYYAKMHEAYKAEGYTPSEVGECPALVAESLVTQSRWAVIAAMQVWFPDVDNHKLLCAGLKVYQEWIDLAVKLIVNHPRFRTSDFMREAVPA